MAIWSGATPDDVESQRVLEMLAATPREIARLVRGLPTAVLERQPTPAAWSARDIVAHLRTCVDVWGGSIERMLAKVTGTTSGAPRTALGYATRMAEHEVKHLEQLRRTLEAVTGPGAGR